MRKPDIHNSCEESYYFRDRWINSLEEKKKRTKQERYMLRFLKIQQAGGRERLKKKWHPEEFRSGQEIDGYSRIKVKNLPMLHHAIGHLICYGHASDCSMSMQLIEPRDTDDQTEDANLALHRKEFEAFGDEWIFNLEEVYQVIQNRPVLIREYETQADSEWARFAVEVPPAGKPDPALYEFVVIAQIYFDRREEYKEAEETGEELLKYFTEEERALGVL
jgi:hypothetical protein